MFDIFISIRILPESMNVFTYPYWMDVTQNQFLSEVIRGLNAECSFAKKGSLTNAKYLRLHYSFTIDGGRTNRFMPFPKVKSEIQKVFALGWPIPLIMTLIFISPFGWGCRVHWLHLCRGVTPPPMSVLDMTLNSLMVRSK